MNPRCVCCAAAFDIQGISLQPEVVPPGGSLSLVVDVNNKQASVTAGGKQGPWLDASAACSVGEGCDVDCQTCCLHSLPPALPVQHTSRTCGEGQMLCMALT
jgi:hypothetical protein